MLPQPFSSPFSSSFYSFSSFLWCWRLTRISQLLSMCPTLSYAHNPPESIICNSLLSVFLSLSSFPSPPPSHPTPSDHGVTSQRHWLAPSCSLTNHSKDTGSERAYLPRMLLTQHCAHRASILSVTWQTQIESHSMIYQVHKAAK